MLHIHSILSLLFDLLQKTSAISGSTFFHRSDAPPVTGVVPDPLYPGSITRRHRRLCFSRNRSRQQGLIDE
jgi:hypothetical protein